MDTERNCPNCGKPLPTGVPLGLCPECLIKSGFPTGTGPGAASPPGGGFVPPPVEELTKLFPQFEILELIGKGGMGAVYKARQPSLDRFVALKILPPVVANDPGFAERFNREARALARLSHPNIVVVYDFGRAGELHYLVMEFVDGANLREVERAGRLTSEQALAIVPQICEALQFAHNEGIVHRDIKPENLLLDKKGRVKITDFGIAKILGVTEGKVSLTGARDVVGTPHYMAPEQIEKPQTVDHRADIYSLGVVFYEMLTGELPLGKFSPPSKKVQVDVRLDEVVLRSLEKEPERRYQQINQVKKDVETITTTRQPPTLGGFPPGGAIPPPIPPQPDNSSDKIILPAFLLAFFFGIFGAHRFYVGKIGTGILQLFTLGGFGIWTTIDWILLLCKAFTDKEGRRLTRWWHVNHYASNPTPPPGFPPSTSPPIAGVSQVSHGVIIAPGVALLVTGVVKLFLAIGILLGILRWSSPFVHTAFYPGHGPLGIGLVMTPLFSMIPALLFIFGGNEMVRRRSYAWAMAAAIVAIGTVMLCSVIGLPAGIWALIVLLLPGTRVAFGDAQGRSAVRVFPWIVGGAAVVLFLIILPVALIGFIFSRHHAVAAPRWVQVAPVRSSAQPSQPINYPAPVIPPSPAETPPAIPPSPNATGGSSTTYFTVSTPGSAPITYQWSINGPDAMARLSNNMATAASEITMAISNVAVPMANVLTESGYIAGSNLVPALQTHLAEAGQRLAEAQKQFEAGFTIVTNENIAANNLTVASNTIAATEKQIQESEQLLQDEISHIQNGQDAGNQWRQAQDRLSQIQSQLKATEDAIRQANAPALTMSSGGTPAPAYQQRFGNAAGVTVVGAAVDFSKIFSVKAGGQLTMDVDRGNVRISGADQDTVSIHVKRWVTHASDAEAAEILREENVTFQQTADGVSITSQDPAALHHEGFFNFNDPNLNVDYEITVPKKFTMQLQAAGGNITVEGISDDVVMKTSGGNLDGEDIRGKVDAETSGGDVYARKCSGPLDMRTSGGNMTIEDFNGPNVRATTEGGSISANFSSAPKRDSELSTSGGNVTVQLPEDAAATLDAHTEGGSVRSDLPVQVQGKLSDDTLKGTLNGGGPLLHLQTEGGDIVISKN